MPATRLDATRAAELRAQPYTYARPGVTAGPDARFTLERERVVGHGRPAFERAADQVLRWQAQVGAGLGVAASDDRIVAGTVVVQRFGGRRLGLDAPCRVVYVVEEPDRRGFAYGSLTGHPESGEEAFLVDLDADGSVRFTIRAVSRPASRLARLGGPVTGIVQRAVVGRYLGAVG